MHTTNLSPSSSLLLSTVLYLCSPPSSGLLIDLAAIVQASTSTVILQSTESLDTVQAFILLSTFAPFGSLPGQPVNPSQLVVARGYVKAARTAAITIALEQAVDLATGTGTCWYSPEVWTWLCLCVAEAGMALESEVVVPSPQLSSARHLAMLLMSVAEMSMLGDRCALGKVLACERILRSSIVEEGIICLRQVLEQAESEGARSAEARLADTLEQCSQQLDLVAEASDTATGESLPEVC
jgi:hypothetical protein